MKRSLDETKPESNMAVERINLESTYEESKKIVEKDILKCKNLCRYFDQCCMEFEEALGLDFVKSILSNEISGFVDDASENGENFKDLLSFTDAGENLREPQDDSVPNCEVSTNQTCEEIIENFSEESRQHEIIKQEIMIERIARSQQTTPIEEKHNLTTEDNSWMPLSSPGSSSFYSADVSENTEVQSSFSYISNTDNEKTLFPESYSETTEEEFSYSMDISKNFAQSSRIESFVQQNNVEKSSSLLVKSLKNQMRLSLCEKGLEFSDLKAHEKEMQNQVSFNENGLDFSELTNSTSEVSVVPSLSFLASNSTFQREEEEEEKKEEEGKEEKEKKEEKEEDVNRDDSKELCQKSPGAISEQNETIQEGNDQCSATVNIDKEKFLENSAVISCDENEAFEANEVTSSFVDIASDYDDKELDKDIIMKSKDENIESSCQKENVESTNHQGNMKSRNQDKCTSSDVVLEEYVIIENQSLKEQSSCEDKETVLGDFKEAAANVSAEITNGYDSPKKHPEVCRNGTLKEDDISENASQLCLQATNEDAYANKETIEDNEIPDDQMTDVINQDPGTFNDDEFDNERMVVLNIKRKRRKRKGPPLNRPRGRKIKSFQKFLQDLHGKKRDDDDNTVSKFRQEPQSNSIRRFRDAVRKSGNGNDNLNGQKFSARLRSPLFLPATDILLDREEEIKPDKVETPHNRSDCFVIMERCSFTAEPAPGSHSETDNKKAKARETAKRIDDMHAQLFEKYAGLTTDSVICCDDYSSDGRKSSDIGRRFSRSNQRNAKTVGKCNDVAERSDSRDRSRQRNITKTDESESKNSAYLDGKGDNSEDVELHSTSDNDEDVKRIKGTRSKRTCKGNKNRKVEKAQKRDSSEKTKEAKRNTVQRKIEKEENSTDSSTASKEKESRNEELDSMEKERSRLNYRKQVDTVQAVTENMKKVAMKNIVQRESEGEERPKASKIKETSNEQADRLVNRSSRRNNKSNARETNNADSDNMSDCQSKAKKRSNKSGKEQDLVEERAFSDNSSLRITRSKRQRNKRNINNLVEDEVPATEEKIEAGGENGQIETVDNSGNDGLEAGDSDKASTANCEKKNRRDKRKVNIERKITEIAPDKASGSEEEKIGTNRADIIEKISDEETHTSKGSSRRALRGGRKKGVEKKDDCAISFEESCGNQDENKGDSMQTIADEEPANNKRSGRRLMREERKGRIEKDSTEIDSGKVSEDSDHNKSSGKTNLAEEIADEESSSVKNSARRVLRGKRKARIEMKGAETESETTSGNSESLTEKVDDNDEERARSKVQRMTRNNNTGAVNTDATEGEDGSGESCSVATEAPRSSTRGKRDGSKTVRSKSELSVVVENSLEDKNKINEESLPEIKENSGDDKQESSETGFIGSKDKNVVNDSRNEERDSEGKAVCDDEGIGEFENGENADVREPGTEECSEGQTTAEEGKKTADKQTREIVRKKKTRSKLNRGRKRGIKSVLPCDASTPLETKRDEKSVEENEDVVCSGLDGAPTSTEIMAVPNAKEKKSKASKRKNCKTEKEKSSYKDSGESIVDDLDYEPPASKEKIDILEEKEAVKSLSTEALINETDKKEMSENSNTENELIDRDEDKDKLDNKVSTSEEKIDVLKPKETKNSKNSKKKASKQKQTKRNRNKVCPEVEKCLESKNNVIEEADSVDHEMEGVKNYEEEKEVASESCKVKNDADNLPLDDNDRANEEIEEKNCDDEVLTDKLGDKEEVVENNDLVVESEEPRPVRKKGKSKTTIANNKENGKIEEKNLRRSARKVKPVKRLEMEKENKESMLEELPPKRKASGKKEPLKKNDVNRKCDDSKIPLKKRRTLFNINKNTSITSVGFSILEDTTLNTTMNRPSNANTSFVPPALHNFLRSFVAPKIKKKTL